jgi:hypothetical protein
LAKFLVVNSLSFLELESTKCLIAGGCCCFWEIMRAPYLDDAPESSALVPPIASSLVEQQKRGG